MLRQGEEQHMGDKLIVRQPGEGDAIWMLGGLYEMKARAEETNGAMTVAELTIPENCGPPPHLHEGGEAVYVLEGRLRYQVGGDVVEAGPGAFFYFPPGTVETFEPIGRVRLLAIYSPGGMDQFFTEAGEPARTRGVPAQAGPPDIERMVSLGAQHGLQLLPPG
jgi:quercetin dioxygenase-like cupin family protein